MHTRSHSPPATAAAQHKQSIGAPVALSRSAGNSARVALPRSAGNSARYAAPPPSAAAAQPSALSESQMAMHAEHDRLQELYARAAGLQNRLKDAVSSAQGKLASSREEASTTSKSVAGESGAAAPSASWSCDDTNDMPLFEVVESLSPRWGTCLRGVTVCNNLGCEVQFKLASDLCMPRCHTLAAGEVHTFCTTTGCPVLITRSYDDKELARVRFLRSSGQEINLSDILATCVKVQQSAALKKQLQELEEEQRQIQRGQLPVGAHDRALLGSCAALRNPRVGSSAVGGSVYEGMPVVVPPTHSAGNGPTAATSSSPALSAQDAVPVLSSTQVSPLLQTTPLAAAAPPPAWATSGAAVRAAGWTRAGGGAGGGSVRSPPRGGLTLGRTPLQQQQAIQLVMAMGCNGQEARDALLAAGWSIEVAIHRLVKKEAHHRRGLAEGVKISAA